MIYSQMSSPGAYSFRGQTHSLLPILVIREAPLAMLNLKWGNWRGDGSSPIAHQGRKNCMLSH